MTYTRSRSESYAHPTTLTAAPTAADFAAAPHNNFSGHIFKIDTSGGDVNLTAFAAAPTGGGAGVEYEFVKVSTDQNGIIVTCPFTGIVYADFNTQGDILTLERVSSGIAIVVS